MASSSSMDTDPKSTADQDAQGNPFADDSSIVGLICDLMEKWHIPGAAIAVLDGDNTWAKGFGFATIDSNPVTPSTLFGAQSTTKAFTAAAVADLIDSGKFLTKTDPPKPISWETPMHDVLLDDFVLMDDWATRHITIEDALCHRSGMPRHDLAGQHLIAEQKKGEVKTRVATVKDVTRNMRHMPLNVEPRTKYQYCNLMYVAASHFVETLTGKWLGAVLQDWIWEPLQMHQTYFSLSDAEKSPWDLATGYYWDPSTGSYKPVRPMPVEEVSGCGAVISSVLDYAKWIRCMVNGAEPLSKASHDAVKIPRIFSTSSPGFFDAPKAYALGWEAFVYKGHRVWGHNGGSDAFGAQVLFIPTLKFGVVVFANTAFTSNVLADVVSWTLVDDKLGTPEKERPDRESKWTELSKAADEKRKTAKTRLYPNLPNPILERPLPLESYAGTYFHSGYKAMVVELADAQVKEKKPRVGLIALRPNATWPIRCEFEHASGDYWTMEHSFIHNPEASVLGGIEAAQFRLGPNGKVASLGIEWRNVFDDSFEGLIWFDRVD